MPAAISVQAYLADAALTAADELANAFLRIPQDKRDWQPAHDARSALDQLIECALLNRYAADLVETKQWPEDSMETYTRDKAAVEAMENQERIALLRENAAYFAAIVRAVSDDDLSAEIVMPWKTEPLSQTIAYGYWNMTYHLGQINYIASLLGCLE